MGYNQILHKSFDIHVSLTLAIMSQVEVNHSHLAGNDDIALLRKGRLRWGGAGGARVALHTQLFP